MTPRTHMPPKRNSQYRLLKRVLRYFPRRAMLHKYPLIGRFASHLRPRAYLWSFRRTELQRSYYAGAIVSLMPLMGIQLPLTLVVCLLLRCNFMVAGGLQLVTNPLTAAPIYYATHRLGSAILGRDHVALPPGAILPVEEIAELGELVAETLAEPLVADVPEIKWTSRVRKAFSALVVGGIAAGAFCGLILDLIDAITRRALPKASRPRLP